MYYDEFDLSIETDENNIENNLKMEKIMEKIEIKKTLIYLKELNTRLHSSGFGWQHEDYFTLKNLVPELIRKYEALLIKESS